MVNANLKFNIMFLLLALFLQYSAESYAVDNYIKPESIRAKRQHVYRQHVYSNVNNINKKYTDTLKLKKDEDISYFVVDEEYDCKNYKYRYRVARLYTNKDRVVSKEKDNAWYNDISRDRIMGICETCYSIIQVRKKMYR